MLHDEKAYSDPDTFNPDRWLNQEVIDKDVDPLEVTFGFGRRCVHFNKCHSMDIYRISLAHTRLCISASVQDVT